MYTMSYNMFVNAVVDNQKTLCTEYAKKHWIPFSLDEKEHISEVIIHS